MNTKSASQGSTTQAGLSLVLYFIGSIGLLLAEGERIIANDAGLYEPAPPLVPDIFEWKWAANQFMLDGEFSDPTAPEGKKVIRTEVGNRWGGWGIFFVDNGVPQEVDFSAFATGELCFFLKSDHELTLELEYGGSGGRAEKVSRFIPSTGNVWTQFCIPISEFAGLNTRRLRSPFMLTSPDTAGPKIWSVDQVVWRKPLADIHLYPGATQVKSDGRRQFTVVGETTEGDLVSIFGDFAVSGPGVIEGAGTSASSVTVVAGAANFTVSASKLHMGHTLTASAAVTVQAGDPGVYGVASETNGSNGVPFPFPSGPVIPAISSDESEFYEGTNSLRVIMPQLLSNEFLGVTWELDSLAAGQETVDLNRYYDGALEFAIKASPELNGKLMVGIRSANVPEGTECSSVLVSDYVVLSGDWQIVRIPFERLAGAAPMADLSRIKNLLTFVVNQPTSSLLTWWVDAIQWTPTIGSPQGPEIISIARDPSGVVTLEVSGTAGFSYSVNRSTNLLNWTPVVENEIPATNTWEVSDASATGLPFGFYEVQRNE